MNDVPGQFCVMAGAGAGGVSKYSPIIQDQPDHLRRSVCYLSRKSDKFQSDHVLS